MNNVVTALAPNIFDWIFFILSPNKDSHKRLDEFEICRIRPRTYELAVLEDLENSPRLIMGETL